jgi:hypothetical protein
MRKLPIRLSRRAWAQFEALTPEQQAQARRLMAALQLAEGGGGRPWITDLRGRRFFIVSALDTHLVYRLVYEQIGSALFISLILVYETPPDPNNG